MIELTPEALRAVVPLARRLARGDGMTQAEVDALESEWMHRLTPSEDAASEKLALVLPDGRETGVQGPRWLVHLLGLRHRAVEIALSTPSGLIAFQRRSRTKREWPGALDMAVAGHVSESDGGDSGWLESAWREMAEEIGLDRRDARTVLVEGALTEVGCPYFCFEADTDRNPPFIDAEVRQIFAATLSGEGLGRVKFADGEVDGLILTTVEGAWHALRHECIASGLRYSLPRYLDWLEQQGSPARP